MHRRVQRHNPGLTVCRLAATAAFAPDPYRRTVVGQELTLLSLGGTKAGQSVLKEALELNPWLPKRAYLIEEPG